MNKYNDWENLLAMANKDLKKLNAKLIVEQDEEGYYSLDIEAFGERKNFAENYIEYELSELINDAWAHARAAGKSYKKRIRIVHVPANETKDRLEIRIKGRKEFHVVQYFDGQRVQAEDGEHAYHTRHSDTDICLPLTILPEGQCCVVNFCGTIITRQPLDVKEETKLMWVSML